MNEHAYDIAYLESELIEACMPAPRAVKAPAPAALPIAVAEAQEAIAQELMAAADIHEALIQQYLRMSSNVITNEWSH